MIGDEVMATMRPFVYPLSAGVDVISEVMSLNRRIKAEQRAGSGSHNGKGGSGKPVSGPRRRFWSPNMVNAGEQ